MIGTKLYFVITILCGCGIYSTNPSVDGAVYRLFEAHFWSPIYKQYVEMNRISDANFESLVSRLPRENAETIRRRVNFTITERYFEIIPLQNNSISTNSTISNITIIPMNQTRNGTTSKLAGRKNFAPPYMAPTRNFTLPPPPSKSALLPKPVERKIGLIPKGDFLVVSIHRLRDIQARLQTISDESDYSMALARINFDFYMLMLDMKIRSNCFFTDCHDLRTMLYQIHFRLLGADHETVENLIGVIGQILVVLDQSEQFPNPPIRSRPAQGFLNRPGPVDDDNFIDAGCFSIRLCLFSLTRRRIRRTPQMTSILRTSENVNAGKNVHREMSKLIASQFVSNTLGSLEMALRSPSLNHGSSQDHQAIMVDYLGRIVMVVRAATDDERLSYKDLSNLDPIIFEFIGLILSESDHYDWDEFKAQFTTSLRELRVAILKSR